MTAAPAVHLPACPDWYNSGASDTRSDRPPESPVRFRLFLAPALAVPLVTEPADGYKTIYSLTPMLVEA